MTIIRKGFPIAVVLCLALLIGAPASADQITQAFEHSLGIGTAAKSFEHRIDLPEALAAKNMVFQKRELTRAGKLVIEREELTPTYYYVKVRLPKALLWMAKGSINVTLTAETGAPSTVAPAAPTDLHISEPALSPKFSWQGLGQYSAITVMDRVSGTTAWERIILNAKGCQLDEGSLKVGHRYVWAVKQASLNGKYSAEVANAFRIGTKAQYCLQCHGSGWVRCMTCNGTGHIVVNGPNGTPVSQICYQCHGNGRQRCTFCNGTGTVQVPVIIPE
jgi:hypothetical protein